MGVALTPCWATASRQQSKMSVALTPNCCLQRGDSPVVHDFPQWERGMAYSRNHVTGSFNWNFFFFFFSPRLGVGQRKALDFCSTYYSAHLVLGRIMMPKTRFSMMRSRTIDAGGLSSPT